MVNEFDMYNKNLLKQIPELLESAQTLLENSQKQKLIPGKHINISETEQGILIEAEDQDLPDALKRWIMEADQKLHKPPEIHAENGINAEWDGSTWHLSLSDMQYPQNGSRSIAADGQKSSAVMLPFQVCCEGYTGSSSNGNAGWIIKVYGWNPDEGRYFNNLIFAGVQEPLEIAETTLIIPSEGWIYVQLRYNSQNAVYTAEVKYSSAFPSVGAGTYYVPLARIVISDQGEVFIGQMHTGNIFAAGRIL